MPTLAGSRTTTPSAETQRTMGQAFVAIAAALFLAAGFVWVARQLDLNVQTSRATGTVVDFVVHYERRGIRSYYPIVEFTTSSGQQVRYYNPWGLTYDFPYQLGEQVPVAYDPAHPSRASLIDAWGTWFPPLALAGIGLLFLIGGLLCFQAAAANSTGRSSGGSTMRPITDLPKDQAA